MRTRATHGAWVGIAIAAVFVACARPSQFDRYLANQQWSDAALEFATDTALRHDERALYRAGILFGTPGRPTYDPPKARELLTALLSRYPASPYHDDANARLLLLDEIVRIQRDSARTEHELAGRVGTLTIETRDLKGRLDSAGVIADSLRSVIARMDAAARDRDSQLQALRRELQRLKEIDLKPRPPAKP